VDLQHYDPRHVCCVAWGTWTNAEVGKFMVGCFEDESQILHLGVEKSRGNSRMTGAQPQHSQTEDTSKTLVRAVRVVSMENDPGEGKRKHSVVFMHINSTPSIRAEIRREAVEFNAWKNTIGQRAYHRCSSSIVSRGCRGSRQTYRINSQWASDEWRDTTRWESYRLEIGFLVFTKGFWLQH